MEPSVLITESTAYTLVTHDGSPSNDTRYHGRVSIRIGFAFIRQILPRCPPGELIQRYLARSFNRSFVLIRFKRRLEPGGIQFNRDTGYATEEVISFLTNGHTTSRMVPKV